MNTKQKLTLAIVAVIILVITIVGVSYAYFVTRVVGDSPTTNVEIITAQYGVNYGDGNNVVSLNNALPGDVIYKMFTVTNPEEVESTYTVQLTQSVPESAQQFLHFNEDGDNETTCYKEDVTKEKNQDCFNGDNYNNLLVSLVEYKGSEPDIKDLLTKEQEVESQQKLKAAFESVSDSSNGSTIVTSQKLTAKTGEEGKQNLGEQQRIEGKTGEEAEEVVKYYILKIEFRDAKKNQNPETTAQVDIKVDLV